MLRMSLAGLSQGARVEWAWVGLSCTVRAPLGPGLGMLWVALVTMAAGPRAGGGAGAAWLQVRLEAWFWGVVGHRVFPGLNSLQGLGADPRTLGPRRLVRRPGVGAHSGGTHSLRCLGACRRC